MGNPEALQKAIGRAVNRIGRYGFDGPRPVDELDAIHAFGDEVVEGLRRALASWPDRELAAGVHLVRLLHVTELTDEVAGAALRRPAPLEAKEEALELLDEAGVEVPQAVDDTVTAARAFLATPSDAGLDIVLAMPEAWRVPVLEAWLADAEARDPQLLQRALGVSAELDAAVVACLGVVGDASTVPALRRLASGADRTLQKAAKKALHRLRTRGVETEVADATEGFSLEIRPDVEAESRAFATGVDGVGGRILWFLAPWRSGGYRLLESVLDDTDGVRKAEILAVTRKDFRAHVDQLRESEGWLVAQIRPSQAVALLRAARDAILSTDRLPAPQVIEHEH